MSRTTFHCSEPHCVCMARLSFTYTYGSWGLCKWKLLKKKSNNFELARSAVTLQTLKRTTDQLNHLFLYYSNQNVCVLGHILLLLGKKHHSFKGSNSGTMVFLRLLSNLNVQFNLFIRFSFTRWTGYLGSDWRQALPYYLSWMFCMNLHHFRILHHFIPKIARS